MQHLVEPGTKELHMGPYRQLNSTEREQLSRMLAAESSLYATAPSAV